MRTFAVSLVSPRTRLDTLDLRNLVETVIHAGMHIGEVVRFAMAVVAP